jgi:hypothetical protein
MILSILLILLTAFNNLQNQDMLPEEKISYRPATVAGSFYPSDKTELLTSIKRISQ